MASTLSIKPIINPSFAVEAGSHHPLGATTLPVGVNFSLASANASSVELLLFFNRSKRICVAPPRPLPVEYWSLP